MERGEIPEELRDAIGRTHQISREFLAAMTFLIKDTARDPKYFDTHLLSYAAEDLLQSAVAIPTLVEQGIHNTCSRELRFLIELSVKLCFIQQQAYSKSKEEKLDQFRKVFETSSISMKNELAFELLPTEVRDPFLEEIGRLYGLGSKYVHWSSQQVSERAERIRTGRTAGLESVADVEAVNEQVIRILSAVLVLLYHSVPSYVAGDWFVAPDGSSPQWLLSASKYLAHIDENFDYKAERKSSLDRVKKSRWENVRD